MANKYMLLEDVEEIVVRFNTGKSLLLTAAQIEALNKAQEVNCININGIKFYKESTDA